MVIGTLVLKWYEFLSYGTQNWITMPFAVKMVMICKSFPLYRLTVSGIHRHKGLVIQVWRHCKTWWRHQMETFSALLAICAGNSSWKSPHKGQWRGALMFSLIYVWINGWVNNRKPGDLRRYRAQHDVTVMCLLKTANTEVLINHRISKTINW